MRYNKIGGYMRITDFRLYDKLYDAINHVEWTITKLETNKVHAISQDGSKDILTNEMLKELIFAINKPKTKLKKIIHQNYYVYCYKK